MSFDDAFESQLDVAVPLLEAHGQHATFYVLPARVRRSPDRWQAVAAGGHEIGSHTATHPCSANFALSRRNVLEDYTIERIETEIDRSSARIESLLGVRPATFAYPCGQSFVGRGEERTSYVPSVARRFVAARSFHGRTANDPERCDLAHLDAFGIDGLGASQLVDLIDTDGVDGRWVIVGGHDVGETGDLTIREDALDALCRRACRDDVWVAPVVEIARFVRLRR